MKDYILKERELLGLIERNLIEIKSFLIGNVPEENCETVKEDCFYDSLKNNLNYVEEIRNITQQLNEIIIGGKH